MPKKGRKSLIVIDLVDDKDISTIVLDDDDNDSDMTGSLVMIDDDSIVNINDDDDDDDSTVNINDDDSTVNINDSDATVNINDNDATVNINDNDSTVNINDDDSTVNINDSDATVNINDNDSTVNINEDATLNINDDDSTVNINDDTLNTTVDSPQKQLAKSDNCDVMTVDDSMVSSNKPKEKSNISEKSVGDEGDIVIEVFNKNQQDRSSKDDEKVVGNEESSKASGVNEDGEKVGTQCRKKRRRRTKCTVSETGAKKAKIDNNTESKGVLSNSDANLVTDEATKLAEAKSGPVLSSRIGKKKLRQRKHLLFQQRKLCKALKRSLVNDSSNLESCLEFLNSSPNGGGKKKGNNVENGGDKEKINDSEGVEEKNDSVDVTEDDDVILVSSSESVRPSQSKPVDVSRFKGLDIWKRPAHLSPNPVSRAIVQQMVNQLSKNKNLLGWTPSSYAQVVANSRKLLSNSANLSQWGAHKSSQSGLKLGPNSSSQWGAHKSRSGLNSGQNSLKWCEHKSQSGLKSGPSSSQWCVHKSSQSGLNCGPMLLNVVAGTTKSASQDAVTVVDDDDDKVVAQPVTSELSLVGNNMFVPSSMPARKGPRPVFIDGCNVAFSHGKNATFSVRGIEICVEYFRRLGNRAFVVLPNHRKGHLSDATLRAWESDGTLIVTPSRRMDHSLVASDDDRYVIQCAAAMDGVIVTKDQYRDHMGINPLWDKTIKNRLLILTWLQDILIFPDDPLGRHGPKLKDFLMY